jgi:hypothetical protein
VLSDQDFEDLLRTLSQLLKPTSLA